MILSDRSINEAIASGRLGIEPFDPTLVQPSSIDVRLDNKFLIFRNTKRAYIDVKQPADDLMEMIEVGPDEPMFLHPHEFVLGSTIERVRMPDDLVARLEGRSSLGRLGVVIHSACRSTRRCCFVRKAACSKSVRSARSWNADYAGRLSASTRTRLKSVCTMSPTGLPSYRIASTRSGWLQVARCT